MSKNFSVLTASILNNLAGLRGALDANHDEGNAAVDTGSAAPSTTDAGISIVLSQMAQVVYNQLKGDIVVGGRKIENALERFENSEVQMAKIAERVNNDQSLMTAADFTTMHYLGINQERVSFLEGMLSDLTDAYRECTRKDWKPWVRAEKVAPVVKNADAVKDILSKYRTKPAAAANG